MESSKWIVSTKLCPLSTKRVVSNIAEETADISTYMRDAEHVHVHNSSNWVVHVSILSVVVTKPVRGIVSSCGVGASCQNKVSLVIQSIGRVLSSILEVLGSPLGHHMSIETVHIVLGLVDARVSGIQWDSVVVIALVVLKVWEERQEPGWILVLREWLVPRVICGREFYLFSRLKTSITSLNLRSLSRMVILVKTGV